MGIARLFRFVDRVGEVRREAIIECSRGLDRTLRCEEKRSVCCFIGWRKHEEANGKRHELIWAADGKDSEKRACDRGRKTDQMEIATRLRDENRWRRTGRV